MHQTLLTRSTLLSISCGVLLCTTPALASAATEAELEARIKQLKQELAAARAELKASHQATATANKKIAKLDNANKKIELLDGHLKIGGAIRANYTIGNYPPSANGAASRAWQDNGNFLLDTFRVNMDYANGPYLGKLEYRWYNGYNFLHTGWLGYQFDKNSQLQVGVNRVPFGPGPYGVSKSWFFDQHYYVGLADNMDLGVKYSSKIDHFSYDLAYYYSDEGTYTGGSRDSARYSYDVVNKTGRGYNKHNQFNLRGIYHFDGPISTDLGMSLEYGQLKSHGTEGNGRYYAGSVHMVNKAGNFTLGTQLSDYAYIVDPRQPLGTAALVQFGAYDFPNTVAARALVPAISLSYFEATPNIPWLDSVTPYIEYSSLIKKQPGFKNSDLFIIGAAWARGGWYIYSDLAFSNGNEFIGGNAPFGDRLGANASARWLKRLNINFGYYF